MNRPITPRSEVSTSELERFLEYARLRRERFFFDLATLCAQLAVPITRLTDALRELRPAA